MCVFDTFKNVFIFIVTIGYFSIAFREEGRGGEGERERKRERERETVDQKEKYQLVIFLDAP